MCPSETPFSTLLDYSMNLARVSEEKAGKELKLIKGCNISESIFDVLTRQETLGRKSTKNVSGSGNLMLHILLLSYTKERNSFFTTTIKKKMMDKLSLIFLEG